MDTAGMSVPLRTTRASEHDTLQALQELSCGDCAPVCVPRDALTAERDKISCPSRARPRPQRAQLSPLLDVGRRIRDHRWNRMNEENNIVETQRYVR